VLINSSGSDHNYTNENITVWINATDSESDTINAYVRWFNQSIEWPDSTDNRIASVTDGVFTLLDYINASSTTKIQNWTAMIQIDDGTFNATSFVNESLIIRNSPANLTFAEINSSINRANQTGENLTLWYQLADLDNETQFTVFYRWFKDSVEQTNLNGQSNVSLATPNIASNITSGNTSLGENWTVMARHYDGNDNSSFLNYSLIINNTLSTVNEALLNSSTGDQDANDDLTLYLNISDPDAQTLTAFILWYRNVSGTPTQFINNTLNQTTTLTNYTRSFAANISRGNTTGNENWTAQVTISDGHTNLSPVNYSVFVNQITNTAPVINEVIINSSGSSENYTNENITVWINASDADDDALNTYVRWFNQSKEWPDSTDNRITGFADNIFKLVDTINASTIIKNENWTAMIQIDDGAANATAFINTSFVVRNSPPNASVAEINASIDRLNETDENLTLWYTIQDLDNETSFTVFYRWFNGTSELPLLNGSQSIGLDVASRISNLTFGNTTKGDTWTVMAKFGDGEINTSFTNYSLTINNTAPTITTVLLNASPTPDNYTFENLTIWVDATDEDDDTINAYVRWFNNSIEWPDSTDNRIAGVNDGSFTLLDYINASSTTKIQNWTAMIQIDDGASNASLFVNHSLIIRNSPANVTLAEINSSTTRSNLTDENLTLWYQISDLDNETQFTVHYRWFNDTVEVPGLNGQSNVSLNTPGIISNITFGNTTQGEKWTVMALHYDGNDNSSFINYSLIINNTAPVLNSISINTSSSNQDTNNNITLYVNVTDADSHTITAYILWYRNVTGTPVLFINNTLNETTLITDNVLTLAGNITSGNTSDGENWTAQVTITDGIDNLSATNVSVEIGAAANTIPVINQILLNSSGSVENYTNENITVWINATDANGDTLNAYIRWFNNSIEWPDSTDNRIASLGDNVFTILDTINASTIVKNENWTAMVQIDDGEDNASGFINASIIIRNSPPNTSLTEINTSIDRLNETDENLTLWHQIQDLDNETQFTVYFRWFNGTTELPGLTGSQNISLDLPTRISNITSGNTTKGQNWTVMARYSDGESNTSFINYSLIINSTRPILELAFINTSAGSTNLTSDNLTLWVNASDEDVDSLIAHIKWFNNSIRMQNTSNYTAQSITLNTLNLRDTIFYPNTTRDENWTAEIIISDGSLNTTPQNFSLIINDTIPTVNEIVINSSPTANNETFQNLTLWINATDLDSDTLTAYFDWHNSSKFWPDQSFQVKGLTDNAQALIFTINSSDTRVDENWTASVIIGDGTINTTIQNYSLIINTTRPVLNSARLNTSDTDQTNRTDEDLTIYINATDQNSDTIKAHLRWFNNSAEVTPHTSITATMTDNVLTFGDTITSTNTSKGQNWTVMVTIDDGTLNSTPQNFSMIINTTVPTITSFVINTSSGTTNYTTENLTLWINATDIDDDTITASVRWFNESVTLNGDTSFATTDVTADSFTLVSTIYSPNTTKGENWTASIIVGDNTLNSSILNLSILINNTPPAISQVVFNTSAGNSNLSTQNLTLWINSTDNDTDTLTTYVRWFTNSTENKTLNTTFSNTDNILQLISTIISSNTTVHDNWTAQIVVGDGTLNTSPENHSLIILPANSAPTTNSIVLNTSNTSAANRTLENLTLWVNTTDTDNDNITAHIRWFNNTVEWEDLTQFSIRINDNNLTYISTILAGNTSHPQNWTAQVTFGDGTTNGTATNTTITIRDTPQTASVIPNQTWISDTNISLNLSLYFSDDDNDLFNFTASFPENITVNITGENLTLIPFPNNTTTTNIIINATNQSTSIASNNITLIVTNDIDSDGYDSDQRSGLDCNDNDANVNPGVAEVCSDSIDNDCDGSIDEGCTTATPSSGDSGGGGGGGGAGGGSSTIAPIQVPKPIASKNLNRKFFAVIRDGESYNLPVKDEYMLGIRFILKQLRTGVNINVIKIITPAEEQVFDANVLNYYEIENNLQKDDFAFAEIVYRIPVELLEEDPSIGLYKQVGSKWIAQPTERVDEKDGFVFFVGRPKSFSLFALSGAPTQLDCVPDWSCTPWSACGEENEGLRERSCLDIRECEISTPPLTLDSCQDDSLLTFIENSQSRRSGLIGRAFGFGGDASSSVGGIIFFTLLIGLIWVWRRKHKTTAKKESTDDEPHQDKKQWFEDNTKKLLQLLDENNPQKAIAIYIKMHKKYNAPEGRQLPTIIKKQIHAMLTTAYRNIQRIESSSLLAKFNQKKTQIEHYLEAGDTIDASSVEKSLEEDANRYMESNFLSDEQKAKIAYTIHTLKHSIKSHMGTVSKAIKNLQFKEKPTPQVQQKPIVRKSKPKSKNTNNISWWKPWGMNKIIHKHPKVEDNPAHIKSRANNVLKTVDIMEKLAKKKEFRMARKWYKEALAEYTILASSKYVSKPMKNKLYKKIQEAHDIYNEWANK